METKTAGEAARYLGLSVQRVRLLAAQGRIKHTRHGKAYVFPENPVIEPPKSKLARRLDDWKENRGISNMKRDKEILG